jgi:GAF domain-containing protein
VTREQQRGQVQLQIVALFVLVGLITSLLTFLGYQPSWTIDPFLIFLLIAYPLLLGVTIYFYLKDRSTAATLQEEYYIKWFLQSFAKVCLTETDLQTMREELAVTILRLIKPALVMVYELNAETKRLEAKQHSGIKNLPDIATQGYTFGEGIPGWVMQNQNTAILGDISKEQFLNVDPWAKSLGFRSYAAVPIIARGGAIGIVAMYSLDPNYYQDSNLLIAQLGAQLYGLSFTNLYGK